MKKDDIRYWVEYPNDSNGMKHLSLHKFIYGDEMGERHCIYHAYAIVPNVYEPLVRTMDGYSKRLRQRELELVYNTIINKGSEHYVPVN